MRVATDFLHTAFFAADPPLHPYTPGASFHQTCTTRDYQIIIDEEAETYYQEMHSDQPTVAAARLKADLDACLVIPIIEQKIKPHHRVFVFLDHESSNAVSRLNWCILREPVTQPLPPISPAVFSYDIYDDDDDDEDHCDHCLVGTAPNTDPKLTDGWVERGDSSRIDTRSSESLGQRFVRFVTMYVRFSC